MPEASRHALLGVSIDALTRQQLLDAASRAMAGPARNLIFGNHNLHSIHLFHKNARLRQYYRLCHLTHVDGMSVIALGRLLGLPLDRRHRTTYLDWIEDFLEMAQAGGWRIFVVGGPPEFAAVLADYLQQRYPSLALRCHHGYVGPEDDDRLHAAIRDFGAQVVMVGMGMPRQEEWILRALPHIQTHLVFNCGAAFEYLAGIKYRPPRWAGKLGLEWLFRWCSEPRRLASRYFVEPVQLLPLLVRSVLQRGTAGGPATATSLDGRT